VDKKEKLNTLRCNVIEMLKTDFFAKQDEFQESCKSLVGLESQVKDNVCRIMVVG